MAIELYYPNLMRVWSDSALQTSRGAALAPA